VRGRKYTSIGLILGRVVFAFTLLELIPEVPLLYLVLGLLALFPAQTGETVRQYQW
jgi:hypothetical protein